EAKRVAQQLAAVAAMESARAAEAQKAAHEAQARADRIVATLLANVKAAGLLVREEMAVACCYANQDKFWVKDPDGVEWEVYHLNFDLDDEGRAGNDANVCCASAAGCDLTT
ncbi:MAG: hypothetical protein LC659_06460, partial [Myxococcales bacterium]|nr:hypothetical protein [Myxococcales bacterium]